MNLFSKVGTAFRLALWCTCLTALFPVSSWANDAQLRLAFQNIRSDDIPYNGYIAACWLYQHRSEIQSALLDELYRTDRQGRDAIFHALMATKGFKPDARFCAALVSRLNDEDKFVGNWDLHCRVHWEGLRFIDARYAIFRPLIIRNMQTSDDMWCIWGTASLLDKHGDLTKEESNFSPHVWEIAAKSLRNDDIEGNAGQAVRFYLMIGKDSLPHLKPLTRSEERQSRNIASAVVDAMGGSRDAYGYLGSVVCIDRTAFSGMTGGPDWYGDEVAKWVERNDDNYRR